MIQLERGRQPDFFNDPKFLSAKQAFLDQGSSKTSQRLRLNAKVFAESEEVLYKRFAGKCVFCESELERGRSNLCRYRPWDGSRGADDRHHSHHYYWLAFEWDNLLLACPTCNKYRRNYFPLADEKKRAKIGATGNELNREDPLLIDPCVDKVEDHLLFHENGDVKPLSKKGEATIFYFGLNRAELKRGRRMAASRLRTRLRAFSRDKSSIDALAAQLFSPNPSSPFVAVQRAVLSNLATAPRPKARALFKNTDFIVARTTGTSGGQTKAVGRLTQTKLQPRKARRFSIRKISIKNFRCIDSLEFELPPSQSKDELREPWLLLLGDNGIGKTSILQGISLALVGQTELKHLKIRPADILKRGTRAGEVRISSFESDEDIVLKFTKSSIQTSLPTPATYVLGYGSVRMLPKGTLKPAPIRNRMVNVGTLFDCAVSLADPHRWVANLSTKEFNEKVAPALFDLLNLEKDEGLHFRRGKIWIRMSGEEYDLESNSDGFRSVVALAIDIMKTLAIEGANYHNVQGIALIDELGNHLHPRWRMKIVNALRRTFPQLQFIVTTHEPLCLRGVEKGEVGVLVMDEQNRVRALGADLLPDHTKLRIDQLLTSDLFGLINVSDEETEKTYEEYYALLGKKETQRTEEDKRRLAQYSRTLSDKELLGSTPQQQALFQMINEVSAQIRQEGFKTSETLKKETIEKVKKVIRQKKLDWL